MRRAARIATALLAVSLVCAAPQPVAGPGSSEARQLSLDDNVYVDANNAKVLGPPVDIAKPAPKPTPPQLAGSAGTAGQIPPSFIRPVTTTGPYRRVFSRPGFSYTTATITLPCSAASLRGDGQRDLNVGFVYTGGWGATPSGAAVDAGFQKSSRQNAKQHEHYSLFIAYASRFTRSGVLKYKTNPKDPELKPYPCGQDVTLEFFPDKNRLLHLNANGKDGNGQPLSQSITHPTLPQDGWEPSGGGKVTGIEIKRMVSIAQQSGDGMSGPWYFGHANASSAPLIRWHDVRIGYSAQDNHAWSMADTYACQNVPTPSIFRVKFSSYDDEAVALDLGRTDPLYSGSHPAVLGAPQGCG